MELDTSLNDVNPVLYPKGCILGSADDVQFKRNCLEYATPAVTQCAAAALIGL